MSDTIIKLQNVVGEDLSIVNDTGNLDIENADNVIASEQVTRLSRNHNKQARDHKTESSKVMLLRKDFPKASKANTRHQLRQPTIELANSKSRPQVTATRQVSSLDVGTSSVRVLIAVVTEFEDGSSDILIKGFGSASSRGMRKGVVINIDSTVKAISSALRQAEEMAGVDVVDVYLSISGAHIKSFNSLGVVGIRDKEVSRYDIQKVIEAAKAVAIPPERELLHVIVQDYIIDGQDGIQEPLGMNGVRLEARVHLVSGSIASATNLVKCANKAGLHVKDLVFAPIAAGYATLTESEKELGVVLLDVGAGTCDISVYYAGALIHSSVIALGGANISNAIAQEFRVPLIDAEKIKCTHGKGLSSAVNKYESFNVASYLGNEGDKTSKVRCSKHELAQLIEKGLHEIFSEIHNHLAEHELLQYIHAGFVLAGETSHLPEIANFVESYFSMPARVAYADNPNDAGGVLAVAQENEQHFSGFMETLNTPEFATALGLLVHASKFSKQSLNLSRSKLAGYWAKVSNWFAEHF